ncbi:MAG: hypothetical protein GY778_26995 [bacterium]|nr:hypothetical protein [bacterium]
MIGNVAALLLQVGCVGSILAGPCDRPAPDFLLNDTLGQPVSLKSYRGAVLFISFGATW